MLKFDRQGLIPAVIQDDITGDVLMLAFMNQEAFQRTRETGYTHFFSRSRNAIWRKGEESGHVQEVRAIFVNCEENSLLLRVIQHGAGACHMGYRSCYYRRLQPDGTYETVAERLFEPEVVYANAPAVGAQFIAPLETAMRQLYDAYLYLRDHDLSEESNTSRLLHESLDRVGQGTINQAPTTAPWLYLVSRLADELQELADVQRGEHVHSGQQPDTILEGSQVGYWLLLLAATAKLHYDDFTPHVSMLRGYNERYSADVGTRFIASEQQENC
ncbi:MAG: phosphoribosyl-AMP cyclohydrolase, partial [Chloroflexi bacterium]